MKQLKTTIEYGLYLLVFLLPIQTRWIIKLGESEYGTVSLYGTDMLLIILIALFVVLKFQISNYHRHSGIPQRRDKKQTPQHRCATTGQVNSKYQISNSKSKKIKIWWIVAGLELMIFISIFFFADDKMIAIYKYGVFLLGIGLFWLVLGASYNKLKLIYCFLAGIFLQATLGIWQFLTQSSFACKWLGMAEHGAGELGTSVVEISAGERWLRAYGGLDHPNVFGGLLVVGLLMTIGLIVEYNKFKTRKFVISNLKFGEDVKQESDFNNMQSCKKESQITNYQLPITSIKYLLLTSYFLLLTSLFFTFSRGAWLGLIIGIIAMLAITVVKKNLLAQKKLLEIVLISSALIFILFSQFQNLALTRLSNGARLEIKSNSERINSYQDSLEMIKDNWLFGVGIGNYTGYNANLANECQSANCEYANAKQKWYYQPVHNVFLLVWAETGIIGLLFFIALLLCVMRYALCDKTNAESRNLNIKISILTATTIMFMVDHWWWSLHFGVLLFWLVIGLLATFKKSENL